MLPRDRVIAVLNHEKPDRVPVTAWLRLNLEEEIGKNFGSVEAFEDRYEFDMVTMIKTPHTAWPKEIKENVIWPHRHEHGGRIEPEALLDVPLSDPNDMAHYEVVKEWVRHHKEERGRFVAVRHSAGFEGLNSALGFENQLVYLLTDPEGMREVYHRLSEWVVAYANNCFDLGADMLLVSDDWGAQDALMFSPKVWWDLLYPAHRQIVDGLRKRRDKYLALHSDGNVSAILGGIAKLGYHAFHPFQESAGMDLAVFKNQYREKFTVMGGIDVQTTLGFGKRDFLKQELVRVIGMFPDGGLILCTSHAVQEHCTMDELAYAFDTIHDLVRRHA